METLLPLILQVTSWRLQPCAWQGRHRGWGLRPLEARTSRLPPPCSPLPHPFLGPATQVALQGPFRRLPIWPPLRWPPLTTCMLQQLQGLQQMWLPQSACAVCVALALLAAETLRHVCTNGL